MTITQGDPMDTDENMNVTLSYHFIRHSERELTMRAIVHRQYGTPDVLAFEEVERPSPATTTCWCGCMRRGPTSATTTS